MTNGESKAGAPLGECTYCTSPGWPTLDGMCHDHYRWLVCNSLRHGADRAEQEWSDAINKVYYVECALGLRSFPSHDFKLGTHVDTPPLSEQSRRNLAPRKKSSRPDDEDEVFI